MKALILTLTLSISTLAQASYFATHCSTADGSVRWETGHNSNTIRFEDADDVRMFSYGDVKIEVKKTQIISNVNNSTCQMNSVTKKFIQEVLITVEDEVKEAEVFCVYHMNGRSSC